MEPSTAQLEVEALIAALEVLVGRCGDKLTLTHRGALASGTPGERIQTVEIGPGGGEWLSLELSPAQVAVRFAGWRETFLVDDDPEACTDSALDFTAAAMFGELRVVEERLHGAVLRRSLELAIGGTWRRYARRGRLGLAGWRARIGGQLERRLRDNCERVRRPKSLRAAAPRGLPRAPWTGAAMLVGAEPEQALAIDGELDLHNFSPKEVAPLVREYIEVCRARGILDLRIVHGKGKGVLRRTVHSLLSKHQAVASYRLGGAGEGSWGATIVRLEPPA